MSIKFDKYKLIELCELITDGSHTSPKSQIEGCYMASVKDMGEYGFDYSKCRKISYEDFKKLSKSGCSPIKNDILIAKDGSPLSNIFIYDDDEPLVLLSSIAIIRPNEEILYREFLKYYLSNSYIKENVQKTYTSGSVIPRIILEDFEKFPIYAPDIENQKKIAKPLMDIDEKIKCIKNINSNIFKICKLIFDYWFLQFDFPYNNKPYNSNNGKMVYDEKLGRKIPKDWSRGNLDNIAEYINGLACQKYRPINKSEKLPVIKITEMHEGFTDKTEFVRSDIDEKHIINDGDILFSWSATLETMIWTGGKGGLNQHIFKVIPKDYGKYYVYMMLSAYINNFVRMAESRKTTMGHITREHLLQSKIPLPPKELTYEFDELVAPLFNKYIQNNIEIRKLNALKEFLLPILLNGQIGFEE
ncbi:MAG: restriction endonuclease subunit S [Methanobrevibacter thaueri]|nr:restriction endonuclease subunit S [Methanobrevibacter thaueri]